MLRLRPHFTPAAFLCVMLALLALVRPAQTPAHAQAATERRFALVIGNAEYQVGALATPANDAGLIAQTLQAAGFDVMGARDLDGEALRLTLRDFLDKVTGAGQGAVAFVYLAGHGVQYEGENYFVPVDAKIERDTDVPLHAIRLSDYLRPLAALPLKARFIVLDAARENPFAAYGNPLASGLALVEPETGSVMAYNAAPGTVAPEGAGPYGAYAQALAEMIRDGGLAHDLVFDRARLRVADLTQGAYLPWYTGRIEPTFFFFERAPDAPTPAVAEELVVQRTKAIRSFEPDEAFMAALDRDTLAGYAEFIEAYPDHVLAQRARAIAAARREAIVWRRTCNADSPEAYWSYLDRYSKGPHAWDARRRLRRLAAVLEPPPTFERIVYDVPSPPPEEIVIVERRVIYFSDPYWRFAPPPHFRVYYLPPPPPDFIVLEAPPPVFVAYALPVPYYVPVYPWVRPHHLVVAPADNVIFANLHTPIGHGHGAGLPGPGGSVVPGHGGPSLGKIAVGVAAVGLAAAALKVALPPGVAKKSATLPPHVPGGSHLPKATGPIKAVSPSPLPVPGKGALPSIHGQPASLPKAQALPGTGTGPAGSAGQGGTFLKKGPATAIVPGVSGGAGSGSHTGAGTAHSTGQVIKPGTFLPPKTATAVPAGSAPKVRVRQPDRSGALQGQVNKPTGGSGQTVRAAVPHNAPAAQFKPAPQVRHVPVPVRPAPQAVRRCGGPGLPPCPR